jgi:hypothetical protein
MEYADTLDAGFANNEEPVFMVPKESAWLSDAEDQALSDWIERLKFLLPLYTFLWGLVHIGSIVWARVVCDPKSSMTNKDKFLWHNKCAFPSSEAPLKLNYGNFT